LLGLGLGVGLRVGDGVGGGIVAEGAGELVGAGVFLVNNEVEENPPEIAETL